MKLILILFGYLCCSIAHLFTSPTLTNEGRHSSNGRTSNRLTNNEHTSNGIFPNGFTNNGFTNNGIAPNGATEVTLTGFTLSAIDLIRESNPDNSLDEIIPYLVRCALPAWKSWTGTINDVETEIWGDLGFAADLDLIPMLPFQQKLVSACLLSLVNFFGEHINISARNYPISGATRNEMKDYRVYEGAFFGNVFSGLKFACQGLPAELALARSPDREWRRCTDTDYDCGMEVMGDCSEVCYSYSDDYGFSHCTGSDGVSYPAINIFLLK